MRKLNLILVATGMTFLLAGCEDVKSVDWWQSHPDEAGKKCQSANNPAMTVKIVVMLKMGCSVISSYTQNHRLIRTLLKVLRVKVKNKRSHYGNF